MDDNTYISAAEQQNRQTLAVVIPAYNEELMVEKAYHTIDDILNNEQITHHFIFVDDGSSDKTWEKLKVLSNAFANITALHFSRNFGKEAAVYAGLQAAIGYACTVVLDCDLQHPPETIVEMYRLWQNGFEIVEGIKRSRGEESAVNHLGAKIFYSLLSSATHIDMQRASDFKLLDQKAVLTIVNMKAKNDFFRALSSWIGYRTTQVEFDVREREAGVSKWSVRSLAKYALNNLSSFSSAPMQLVTLLGCIEFVFSIVLSIITLVQKLAGTAQEGFTTVIISQTFSSSIIMISLGIIGYYLAKVYEEVKGRPRFIISEQCGCNKNDAENTETF